MCSSILPFPASQPEGDPGKMWLHSGSEKAGQYKLVGLLWDAKVSVEAPQGGRSSESLSCAHPCVWPLELGFRKECTSLCLTFRTGVQTGHQDTDSIFIVTWLWVTIASVFIDLFGYSQDQQVTELQASMCQLLSPLSPFKESKVLFSFFFLYSLCRPDSFKFLDLKGFPPRYIQVI